MADTACHVLHAPLQRGLTLVLGLVSRTVGQGPGNREQLARARHWLFARAVSGIGSQPCNTSAPDRRDPPQDSTDRVGFGAVRGESSRTRKPSSSFDRAERKPRRLARAVVLFGSGVGLSQLGRKCRAAAA